MFKHQKTINRHKEIILRRNYLPTFVVTILLWLSTAGIVYFTDPSTTGAIPIFFLVIFVAMFFTFSIIFISSRRGFISSLGLTAFLTLRYFGIGNWLNFILLVGVCLSLEIYLTKRES